MKNVRLFIILGVLAFLTTIIILCSTVFTLNTVYLGWLSTTNVLSSTTDKEIIGSGDFKIGESVFLLDKEKYRVKLEKSNPYLKVENLELKFPNKLKVTVSEREEMFVLKIPNTKSLSGYSYVYLDYDLKVLNIVNDIEVVPNQQNPAVLTIEGLTFSLNDFVIGEISSLPCNDTLYTFGQVLTNVGYTNILYKALIKTVNLKCDVKDTLEVSTTYGLNLKLINSSVNTANKILKAFSIYEFYHNEHPEINDGDITVYQTDDGVIEGTGPLV